MLQLCLHSLLWTKGPCHIRHDWWGCRRIVRAYLHETPVGEPARAGRFVLPLFVLHTCQAGMLQHNTPSLTVSLCDEISLHFWEWFTMSHGPSGGHYTPNVTLHDHTSSLSNLCSSASGKSHSSKHLSLMFVSSLYHFWIANDKWCSKEKSYQRTWQWRALKKGGNNGTLDWSFWRSHLRLLF